MTTTPTLHTRSVLNMTAGKRARMLRYNPLGSITTQSLIRALDAFDQGYLREAANIWNLLEDRDDILRTVIAKRKKSVARYGWAVIPRQGLPEHKKKVAERHVAALEFFYSNLDCESAVDDCQKGGFKLLARQMMDAVGKCYSVHEIVWQLDKNLAAVEGADRRFITAKFRHVPIGFFESTTGMLRFLEKEGQTEGVPLQPGSWMVTCGDGLMKASSIAWLAKNIALNDWLRCSERQGTPALRGSTTASEGSDEWTALEDALENILEGQSVVTGSTSTVEAIDLLANSNLPFPLLVERMDRMMAALWRGADLSTISRDRGYGASLQEKETQSLEEDDCAMVTETLNLYVDSWVIKYVFGDVEPLANVRVLLTPRQWTETDIQIDEFLLSHGAPLPLLETMSRYGRSWPKPGEEIFRLAQKGEMPHATRVPLSSEPQKMRPQEAEPMENQAQPMENEGAPVDGLANSVDTASLEWLQLAPYGDFPHARGMQRVDRSAADGMVAEFGSFRSRLGRLFGGLPIYAGHPDEAGAHPLEDRKAYGWIREVEAREDGLYGRAEWSPAGLELVQNGHYKFVSPRWSAQAAAGVLRPTALVSVGLTNRPNLPVRALSNSAEGLEKCAGLVPIHEEKLNAPVDSNLVTNSMPNANTISITQQLRIRRDELASQKGYSYRIREAVLAKTTLGLTYDEAWEALKKEHPSWFRAE